MGCGMGWVMGWLEDVNGGKWKLLSAFDDC